MNFSGADTIQFSNFQVSLLDANVRSSYTTLKHLQLHYSFKWPKVFRWLSYIQGAYFGCHQIESRKAYVSFLEFHQKFTSIIIRISLFWISHQWLFNLCYFGVKFYFILLLSYLFVHIERCAWNSFLLVYWEHVNTFFIVIIFRM